MSVLHGIAVGGVIGTPLAAVGDVTGAAIVTAIFGLIQLGYNEYLRRVISRTQHVAVVTQNKVKELDRRKTGWDDE